MTTITRSDDLAVLVAVADAGSFSAAAELLDIQVAKVSRVVARVEQQLAVTLFQRTTRRVELTEEGRGFVERSRIVLNQMEEAEEWLRVRHQNPSGRLRINATSPFILHQLIPHIAAFNTEFPDIQVELQAGESIDDLLEKRTDVAIRVGHLCDSTLYSRVLGRSKLFLVASPGYLEKYGYPASVENLKLHKTIGFLAPTVLNHWPVAEEQEIEPDLSANNGEIIRQLCLAGNGIACLSNFMIREDLKVGRLVKLLDDEMVSPHPRERVQAVYYRNTALSSRISVFLDFIDQRLSL